MFLACNLFKKAGLSLLSLILLAHVSTNLLFILILDRSEVIANYLLGVGRADCTGPVAEIPLVSWGIEHGVGEILIFIISEYFLQDSWFRGSALPNGCCLQTLGEISLRL